MKKILLSLFIILYTIVGYCQTVDITTATAGTTTAASLGLNQYFAAEYIYTDAEIGASNFTSAATALNKIGFNASAIGSGAALTFNNVKIYVKEIGAVDEFPSGSTVYLTAGYTQVFGGASGGTVVVSAAGWIEIPITPFTRTTANNLQVLIERADAVSHTGFNWRYALGNNVSTAKLSCRRYSSTTVPFVSGTSLFAASAFRAQIRFKHEYPNDASVTQVYTLGKLPIPNSTPHTVSANITNNGTNTLTALPVTLNVTGANSFTNMQTIATLAPGASTAVTFASYSPTVVGADNISVSIPADDDNSNNLKTVVQNVNTNTWSYAIGSTPQGSTGTLTAGDLAAKFNTSVATAISQVTVNFLSTGLPYKIGIWSATGIGTTPVLIYETATLTTANGVNVVPILPSVAIPAGDFYVGVRQPTNTNIQFGYQIENPVRTNTFLFVQPPTFATWTDFAPLNTFRFMIEPKLQLPIDANMSAITIPSTNTCISTNETVTAVLSNVGSTPIAPNSAIVTLKITGANPQTLAVQNASNILSGATELITFTGINFSNAGINYDTVYVNLAGDIEKANDTAKTTHTRNARNVALDFTPATYPLTRNCDEQGWTYYVDANGKNTLAIEWGNNIAAKNAATASTTLDATAYGATTGSGAAAKGTFTMKRYWNVDASASQPTTPVNVRFFFDPSEKSATDLAAANFQAANAGSVTKVPSWFKTNAGAFVSDAAHVTSTAVVNAIPLVDVNGGLNTINGVMYAQFDAVTSFSGGTYASGVGTTTVLPADGIAYLKGSKQGTTHLLDWKLSCTSSTSLFVELERSSDGRNFVAIETQTASYARCQQAFEYIDANPLTGVNYYRVKIKSDDGIVKYSTIVVLLNKEKGFELVGVSPNPVKDVSMLSISSAKAGKMDIMIHDITGANVAKQNVKLIAGNNLIHIDANKLAAGTYTITAINSDGDKRIIRFVKY
jgi:Secretion system C-terminal sorting domain